MKRVFLLAAVAAATLATSCGSSFSRGIDTLSYCVGVNVGMSMRFGMEGMDVDRDIVVNTMEDFYKNGSLEDPKVMENRQKMMEFQYGRYMQYLHAKRMQDMVETDRPDTLEPLPALYDDVFTRESVSEMIGLDFGAMAKGLNEKVDIKTLVMAIDDCQALESVEQADTLLRLSEAQMRDFTQRYVAEQQRKAQEEREKAMKEHEKAMKENTELSAKWLEEVAKEEGVLKTESGLLYRIDRQGSEVMATKDEDVVLVHYEGKTRNGNIFDSSYERNEPISFGLNQVIKGWTEGMKLVGEGGQITLWIPSELAYGERGAGADIGPNEALTFKVELLKVNPEE